MGRFCGLRQREGEEMDRRVEEEAKTGGDLPSLRSLWCRETWYLRG